jgi:hypothetical protein
MGYDIGWGPAFAALPTGTPVHAVITDNPNYPGLPQMHYYEDPYTASKNVNLHNNENIALTSGSTMTTQHGSQYWDESSQRGYMYPKVLLADGAPASGLDGVAYPFDTTAQAL